MSNTSNVTAHYAEMFKAWQANQLGPKPTAEMLSAIHGLGARPGKQALACAMALRDKGVTAGQIVIACGAPQLNKMRGFVEDSLLKRMPAPKTAAGHTVYKLELTAKGKARIERAEKAAAVKAAAGETTGEAAKPAKAKRKAPSKAKGAAKPAKPDTAAPAVDATSASASVTVTAPDVGAGTVENQPQA